MGKVILITGGARSGKSAYALTIAGRKKGKVAFIATAQAKDAEMKSRISLHKVARPKNWVTFEEPHDIAILLKKLDPSFRTAVIDCLTLWITNLIMKKADDACIEKKTREMLDILKNNKIDAVFVTNEVGLGIVPDNKLARRFRDIAGRVNQAVARQADEMYFMISSMPLKMK
jgi:adenosylcobinamide kinase/adenosylcobinamide-phosphate guanylyltransferase